MVGVQQLKNVWLGVSKIGANKNNRKGNKIMERKKIENNEKKQAELELGKYLESDMLSIADDENVVGGATPTVVLSVITAFISQNTCPTTACSTRC